MVKKSEKICPKCGKPGYETIKKIKKGNTIYEYRVFAHNYKRSGKWTKKWCYLERVGTKKVYEGQVVGTKELVPKLVGTKPLIELSDKELEEYWRDYSSRVTTLRKMLERGVIISSLSPEELEEWEKQQFMEEVRRARIYLRDNVEVPQV